MRVSSDVATDERLDAGDIGRRAEVREHAASRVELERGRLLVAQREARRSQERTRARRLVGSSELVPRLPCPAERNEGGLGVELRERELRSCVRRRRTQHLARLPLRDLLELAAGGARRIEIAAGQHDLDVRRQQRRALQRQGRLADCPSDGGGCGVYVALRQPQHRQAWLRLSAEPACLSIGQLRSLELTTQAVDLTLSVGSMATCALVQDSLREFLADATRFLEGLRPRTFERHDLGAVHEAQALVGHHLALLLAPARQRRGPLARTTQLVHVAAERNRVAVEDAG